MAFPGKPDDALLFIAFAHQPRLSFNELLARFISPFGEIYAKTASFPFSYSTYYETEMGRDLQKVFVIYRGAYDIEQAVAMKLRAMALEAQHVRGNRRTVNIDPGYLTLAKLVLTTTKNYDHRIHLGSGIFGDVQLRYRRGEFVKSPWTYPDYQEPVHLDFFEKARTYLHQLVKAHETHVQDRRR